MIAEAHNATRLMEALEKLGQWAGTGLGGSPSGPPSEETVRAFEQAMEGEGNPPFPEEPDETLFPGPAQSVPFSTDAERGGSVSDPQEAGMSVQPSGETESLDQPVSENITSSRIPPVEQTDRVQEADNETMRELGRLLEDMARPGSVISPDTLFRAQYLMGMLNVQAKTGMKASQGASEGLESLLRQQG